MTNLSDDDDHDLFACAATVVHTRAQLDQLLLDALTEPGLAERSCAALGRFLDGPMADGRAAMQRLVPEVGGAA